MAYSKKADKNLSAMGAGERESKKVATIYKKDGTSFKRKNANQFYPDGVPGGLEYTEKRPNRTDKGDWYKDGGKAPEMKKGGKTIENSYSKKADKNLSAMGAGERESKKVATIYKKDGTSFKRKNANQFYPDGVPGGLEYTEKRPNRTDKGDWLENGGMTDTFVYTIGGL
jgi:hypothetical protein